MQTYMNALDKNKKYSHIFPSGAIYFDYLEKICSMLDGYSYSYIATYLEINLGSKFHPNIGKALEWIKSDKGETGLFRDRTINDLRICLERCPFIQPEELTCEDIQLLVEFSEFTYDKF
ncbi:hypothetical protein HN020_14850 [Brevibacillus borstelensis]|nr:hypothetical protein [Brevibacillus borstelensis]MCC0567424.1 hypothetical protein [Brevibacillus borstelensis]MCM3561560.1 hypothetical protein [Brevibacillus borstelensis]NOU56022.1 hypothetical protein [Brevibacillus borstelensis]